MLGLLLTTWTLTVAGAVTEPGFCVLPVQVTGVEHREKIKLAKALTQGLRDLGQQADTPSQGTTICDPLPQVSAWIQVETSVLRVGAKTHVTLTLTNAAGQPQGVRTWQSSLAALSNSSGWLGELPPLLAPPAPHPPPADAEELALEAIAAVKPAPPPPTVTSALTPPMREAHTWSTLQIGACASWGVAAAAGGLGGYFGWRALGHQHHAHDPTYVGGQLEIRRGEISMGRANFSYAIAATAVLTGALLWLLDTRDLPATAGSGDPP